MITTVITAVMMGVLPLASRAGAQEVNLGLPAASVRLDAGRFTFVAERHDEVLARALLAAAQREDTFPGLPRPRARVLVALAPDGERFRQWIGPAAPEWGAAVAFPDLQRVIMQGSRAGSDAGDPLVVLRHELAHLALHEHMGALPPRWFDEGYASVAAREWTREQTFETSVALVWRTLPGVDSLDRGFYGGAGQADWSYALAHRVVAALNELDPDNGMTNFFRNWKETGSFEPALRLSYGITGAQFDKHWHGVTRRRYGALALVSNLSIAVALFTVILGPLVVSRRRRDRRRLEVMRATEAAQERAARESALEALLQMGATPSRPSAEP
ncbi:MAG TPA: hypothetical protein VE869_04765 [Gemmatimonas sp.]|nr:hypothetical protein [Gemmatimonas sp.]